MTNLHIKFQWSICEHFYFAWWTHVDSRASLGYGYYDWINAVVRSGNSIGYRNSRTQGIVKFNFTIWNHFQNTIEIEIHAKLNFFIHVM